MKLLLAWLFSSSAFAAVIDCRVSESHDFSKPSVVTLKRSPPMINGMGNLDLGRAGEYKVSVIGMIDLNRPADQVISFTAMHTSGVHIQADGKSFMLANSAKEEAYSFICQIIH